MSVEDNLGTLVDKYANSDKTAIIDRGTTYKYKQLNIDIKRFASGIKDVTELGDVVSIDMFNSYQFVVSYLGTIRAGRVALPFNFKVPYDYKDYVYADSKTVITITHDNFEQFLGEGDYIANVSKETPALMLYTSGSTSLPKGVVMPHDHKWFIKKKVNENKFIGSRIILISGPCYHASGLRNTEIGLHGYATLIFVPDFEANTVAEAISTLKPTSIATVPTIISRIVNDKELLARSDFSSIKNIIAASAPVTEQLYKQVAEHFPNANLINRYGLTEIGPGLFHDHPDDMPTPMGSVGYPLSDLEYRLIGGVLQIKSPAMMLNYNNLQPANLTEDGFYITNDIFRVDENGFYFYIGRADDMFTNGGNNIYPRTIEEVIETHPSVSEAAVVGVDDEIKGGKPYAFVTTTGLVTEQELKDLVLQKLPASHCPKKIWFIDHLPLNTVNKIDRTTLKLDAQQRVSNGII